jgi:class 3 adenylate cyclase
LLNILPLKVMQEMKATGKTKACSFDQVSVIFADFKDFSKISATLSPEILVEALEDYVEALKNHLASLSISEEIGDKIGAAKSYNNIGNIYELLGDYPNALTNHFASLKLKR